MSKKGFTLLELTLAIAIFSIGILGIIFLFPQGLKSIKSTIVDLSMSVSAENILEEVKEKHQTSPYNLASISNKYSPSYPEK